MVVAPPLILALQRQIDLEDSQGNTEKPCLDVPSPQKTQPSKNLLMLVVVAHTFNSSTREAEVVGFLLVHCQPGLHSELQDSHSKERLSHPHRQTKIPEVSQLYQSYFKCSAAIQLHSAYTEHAVESSARQ